MIATDLRVRYFASLREALGEEQALDFRPGETVAALRERLCSTSAAHAEALATSRAVRCAVNQVLADASAEVPAGAEVAFFPPVTGG